MDEFPEILRYVSDFLTSENVNYVIVGGVAVMYHGVPRTTVDIDIILQIDDSKIPDFVEFLNSKGFIASMADFQDAFAENSHSTIFYRNSMLRLDIQGVNSDFDQMTLNRAIIVRLFDTGIKLATAEDTLVNKILFESEQDLRDAFGIFTRNHKNLDFEYIESTCALLNILDKWKSFLSDFEMKNFDLKK
jgi:hypothetical protein